MANEGINVIGNPNNKSTNTFNYGDTTTIENQINALNRLRADEQDFEENLNRLKVSNAEKLRVAELQKVKALTDAYMSQFEKLLRQQQADAETRKKEEIDSLFEQGKISKEERDKQWEEEKKKIKDEANLRLKQEREVNKSLLIDEDNRRKKEVKDKEKAQKEEIKRLVTLANNRKKSKEDELAYEEAIGELYEKRKIVDKDGVERYETEAEARERANKAMADAELQALKDNRQAMFDKSYEKLMSLAKKLDSDIENIAGYKSKIDTRLYGSSRRKGILDGSYWTAINTTLTGFAGLNPIVKQSNVTDKVVTMIDQGIAFNVEQRAGLQELAGKIATTFNATNATLLRLVRIQQQDTTAGRLGMEAALNAFLNNMYETTEYMSSIANAIKGNIEEAMSLMTGEAAVSFEYQVQKWLGSLYSVGMSDSAVSNIGSTLGKIAAGQLEGLTSGGASNLLIMAANSANIPISSIMNEGLNADTTNALLNAMVEYLAKIYAETGNSRVVQQQFANVFGLTASDLRAVANLAPSIKNVSLSNLSYNSAMSQLNNMAWSAISRTSAGELMNNMINNIQYGMATSIAANPILQATWAMSNMLDDLVGGIPIPMISVLGNTVDLHTTVADLMKVGALSGGILSALGKAVIGMGKGAAGLLTSGMNPMLGALGIYSKDRLQTVTRGSGQGLVATSGKNVSESGSITAGNTSGSDVQQKTMTEANDDSNNKLATASDESEDVKLSEVNDNVVNIYKLLSDVVDGTSSLRVKIYETLSTTQGTGI